MVFSSRVSAEASTGMSLPVASTRLATSAKGRYLQPPLASTMSIGWVASRLSSSSALSGRWGRIAMPPLRSMLISCSASSTWSSTRRRRMTASCAIYPQSLLFNDLRQRLETIPEVQAGKPSSQGALARLAGEFPYQPGHQVAGQAGGQGGVKGAGFGVGYFEMRGALDPVQL